jgi:release factor glutamine methyltransferase
MATEIRSLIDEGAARLGHVAEEPRREAEVLLGAALGRPRAWLLAHAGERVLDCEATDRYEALVTRRALGEPVAYLLGEKEFWSLPLAVGPGVLIPRPETERLVECALARLPADRPCAVLDLATGSGAIALAIASERPNARVLATDLSEVAAETARANAARLGLEGRVAVHAGDWYAPVAGRRFDVIVSNPPYIAAADPRVTPSVRRYEPPQALFAGADGLEALRAVVGGAPGHLVPGGWLLVEHGDTQAAAVRELFEVAGLEQVQTHRDLAGRERCTEGRSPGRESASVFGDSFAGTSGSR